MAILTECWCVDLALLVCSLLSALYLYYLQQFRHWKIRYVTKPSFPFGDVSGVGFKKCVGEVFRDLYFKHSDKPYIGMFGFFKPLLLVNDPELIKTIIIKEFSHFQDRGLFVHDKKDPLSGHLLLLGGAKWRNLRTKLTPTFTSGKMKMMYPTLVECSKELVDVLSDPAKKGEVLEIKEIAARFTTDVISLCAFGIATNSLKNPNAEFREMGRKLIEPNFHNALNFIFVFFLPSVAKIIGRVNVPEDVTQFFMGAVKETMDYRETNNVKRNDFMQLLIELKNKGKLDDANQKDDGTRESTAFTFEEAAAQAFVFFFAGFETSSTLMQFALYELALSPEIQDKTREEIRKVLAKHNGEMNYEAIHEMSYLGQVIDETLRKYPPSPTLRRACIKDFPIPDTNDVIRKGTAIQMPVWGIQMDPKYFPNPEKFDPDRFTEEEKAKRHRCLYLPFGDGPRNCIGMRFGLMQARVGLVTLLANYKFEVCDKTPIPLKFDSRPFILTPKHGMYLKITAVN